MTGVRQPSQVRAIGQAVETWGVALGSESRRPELPWRSTSDPWAVLVSEVMAQQTQLSRVIPAYDRFLIRFPTVRDCAEAGVGEVLLAWRGLGYNRRARNLHGAAVAVVADHGGRVPSSLPELLTLPGVGAYTARAVLAFAYRQDVGVVDTNAGRVLSRAVAGRPLAPSEAQRLVDTMVPTGRAWHFGQALLDLGATVCTSRLPDCGGCPIRRRCRWAADGRRDPDPATGSAGVSTRQATFVGSDRQGRGRLVEALRNGTVRPTDIAAATGWPDDPERAGRIAEALVAEGLVARDGRGFLRLP